MVLGMTLIFIANVLIAFCDVRSISGVGGVTCVF